MDIVVPGTSKEFDKLFKDGYKKNNPTYFRLSDYENNYEFNVKYGKGHFLNQNSSLTILAFGPTLNFVMPVFEKYKTNLAYFTTIRPLDYKLLKRISLISKNIIIIEPFYTGSVTSEIMKIIHTNCKISNISVPKKFLTNYGLKYEHDYKLGFSVKYLSQKVRNIIKK
tara:strand:- start:1293 stop:1796 length:504 start_codon:yes stop_codon:yes gene_type:complete